MYTISFILLMMFNFLSSFKFHRFFQSGMYFDFFYKKVAEIFVRNIFIYMAQFFGEKYMIEHWTKKFFTNIVFNTNKFISFTSLSYSWFFFQFISITLYILIIITLL